MGFTPPGERLNANERMMWSTYPVATQKGMATGFVVARRDSSVPGGIVPVVVTSTHVISTMGKGPLYVGIRIPDEKGEAEVAVLQLQPTSQGRPFYVRHPHQDVCAFSLRIPPEAAGILRLPSALQQSKVKRNADLPRAGTEVFFLGYPEVAPGTGGGFPVLRSGRVASYPTASMRNQRKFLVDADVYPGDSGAPVYITRHGRRPELAGMIIQRMGKEKGSFAHLAIAVDASVIAETLQILAAREAEAGGAQEAIVDGVATPGGERMKTRIRNVSAPAQ